jgi:hypothetical protein
MSRSSAVPVRALPIQGLRVDQGMGRFPTGRRPGPSQALRSGPVSNREHDRPGGPSGRRRRSAFPVPRRPGSATAGGAPQSGLGPSRIGHPELQTLFPQFRTVRRHLRPGRLPRSSSPSTAAVRPCCCRCCCRWPSRGLSRGVMTCGSTSATDVAALPTPSTRRACSGSTCAPSAKVAQR